MRRVVSSTWSCILRVPERVEASRNEPCEQSIDTSSKYSPQSLPSDRVLLGQLQALSRQEMADFEHSRTMSNPLLGLVHTLDFYLWGWTKMG